MFDALPPAEPVTVETVVVQAPRPAPNPGDAAFSIVRLDGEDLRQAPRADEALKQVPGASLFRRTGSGGANATIQGMSLRAIGPTGAGRALVTLDGVPQNDPFGGWVIWAGLPPETLAGAAVVRGAGAGPYGAGALTGVITLEETDAGPGAWRADAFVGELGSGRIAGAAQAQLGSGVLLLGGSGEHSDGWTPVREGRGAADTDVDLDAWSAVARYQIQIGRASAALRLGAYDEAKGAGLVGADSRASGLTASLTAAAPSTEDRPGWRAQAWVRDTDFENRSVAVGPGRAFTTPANDQYATPALGWGVNAALTGGGERLSWEAGLDARFADGESQENFRFMAGAFTRNRVAGGRAGVAGAYVDGAWRQGPWLLAGGARLDGWRTSDGHRVETDLATGTVLLDDRPADRDGVVPTARLGLRRDLTPELYLRGAAYAGFRPPTLNELHRPFRVGNDVTEANAALEPERLYGAELGIGGEDERGFWAVAGFWNRLDEAVTNVTIGFGPGTFPRAGFIPAGGVLRERRNAGAIEAWGVEAEVAREVGERLSLRAAMGLTDAEVDGGLQAPQLTGLRPAQAPRWTVTAGADWAVAERLELQAALRYESARFEDDLNTRRLSSALAVDARLAWRLTDAAFAYLAADNLFDAAIEIGETADGVESFAAPRALRIGFTLQAAAR